MSFARRPGSRRLRSRQLTRLKCYPIPVSDEFHLVPVFATEADENRDVVLSREHTKSEWRCTEGTQAALNFRCSAKPSPAICATS